MKMQEQRIRALEEKIGGHFIDTERFLTKEEAIKWFLLMADDRTGGREWNPHITEEEWQWYRDNEAKAADTFRNAPWKKQKL